MACSQPLAYAVLVSFFMALVLAATACNQTDFEQVPLADEGESGDEGPGGQAWDEDVTCAEDSECAPTESCVEGVCQMARCKDGPYDSAAPIGQGMYFFHDREIVIADSTSYEGKYWVDGYAPNGNGIDYPNSWEAGGSRVVDVAGGDVFGTRPEAIVIANEGASALRIAGSDTVVEVGFQPVAIAAGDVDRDKIDEVVVLGAGGDLAICHMERSECDQFTIDGIKGLDIAVGDVDGDRFAEPVLLLEFDGERFLYVWNTDVDITGHADFNNNSGHGIARIAAGDLDGDGRAEIIGLEHDGWNPFGSAKLYIYAANGEAIAEIGKHDVHDESNDLSLADVDMNEKDEVTVLRDSGRVELLVGKGNTGLDSVFVSDLQVSATPDRIATTDFDGDSPAGRLVNEVPKLVPGSVVPTVAVFFPPYDRQRSDGVPSVLIGKGDTMQEDMSDSLYLGVGVDVGVSGGIDGLFSAKLSVGLREEVTTSHTISKFINIGDRFSVQPDIDAYGTDYGIVVLSCGCFHAYFYELEDPSNKLGEVGDGGEFVMMVPVGGQRTIWSTKRYNAMAEAVGNLPIIEVPHEIGNPDSYPAGPFLPDGEPVPSDAMVFPDTPTYAVSDVSSIGWWLSVTDSESNAVNLMTTLSMNSNVNVSGFEFGSQLGVGWGQGYALTIGKEAIFSGNVPPIPDDPSTPEDEYAAYGFAFKPYVYRQPYKDSAGNDAAYYVMDYAVGR